MSSDGFPNQPLNNQGVCFWFICFPLRFSSSHQAETESSMPFREDEDEYQQPPPHGWILNPDGSLGESHKKLSNSRCKQNCGGPLCYFWTLKGFSLNKGRIRDAVELFRSFLCRESLYGSIHQENARKTPLVSTPPPAPHQVNLNLSRCFPLSFSGTREVFFYRCETLRKIRVSWDLGSLIMVLYDMVMIPMHSWMAKWSDGILLIADVCFEATGYQFSTENNQLIYSFSEGGWNSIMSLMDILFLVIFTVILTCFITIYHNVVGLPEGRYTSIKNQVSHTTSTFTSSFPNLPSFHINSILFALCLFLFPFAKIMCPIQLPGKHTRCLRISS